MRLHRLLPALLLALLASAAQAQLGVYFNPIVTPASTSQADTGPFAFLGAGTTSRVFGGVSFGGYYDLAQTPRLSLGIDLRDELQHGNSALLNDFLIGARVSGKLSNTSLKPYAQLSGGIGTTRSPLSIVRANKPTFKIYGGLDYGLNQHVDFRVVEVGYSSLTTISSALYGGRTPIPAVRLISFSSGLVFRFK